jgi:hypothetical protein
MRQLQGIKIRMFTLSSQYIEEQVMASNILVGYARIEISAEI